MCFSSSCQRNPLVRNTVLVSVPFVSNFLTVSLHDSAHISKSVLFFFFFFFFSSAHQIATEACSQDNKRPINISKNRHLQWLCKTDQEVFITKQAPCNCLAIIWIVLPFQWQTNKQGATVLLWLGGWGGWGSWVGMDGSDWGVRWGRTAES